ncbi:hypothetical protein Peur_015142 [Populus x canadensis]
MDSLFANQSLSRLKLSPKLSNPSSFFSYQSRLHLRPTRCRKPYNSFKLFAVQSQQETQSPLQETIENFEDEESYGEVSKIIGSRALEGGTGMEYLLEWKDGHPPSWFPSDFVAKDVVAEYETPWWTAAKKADESSFSQILSENEDGLRDVNAVDSDGRPALLFVSGLGFEPCVKLLAEAGADLDHRDKSGGLTALHMAAGYVMPGVVKLLVDVGADPEVKDDRGLTPFDLAKEILRVTPKGNPMQFERRLGMGDNEWVKAKFIGEYLVRDFEAGLEYAVAEGVMGKRPGDDGKNEYLVSGRILMRPRGSLRRMLILI